MAGTILSRKAISSLSNVGNGGEKYFGSKLCLRPKGLLPGRISDLAPFSCDLSHDEEAVLFRRDGTDVRILLGGTQQNGTSGIPRNDSLSSAGTDAKAKSHFGGSRQIQEGGQFSG